ncbi:MAG: hypothetical protein QM791_05290 [Ferruginibacter sp.]
MNSNIDFKSLWGRQQTVAPDTKELFEKAARLKKTNRTELVKMNILLTATAAFILFVWLHFKPEMISTKIGIVLIILAIIIYLFVYNIAVLPFIKNNNEVDNAAFLSRLLQLKKKQAFIQRTLLSVYFLLLAAGLCFYMFEYTSRMTLLWATVCYGITLCWVALNWFYFRPRAIKKQQAKINDLITRYEALNLQITSAP